MEPALDIRLREIRSRLLETDPLLDHLVSWPTRIGVDVQIGLVFVLGSHLVRGQPERSETFAQVLDENVAHYFRVLGAIHASDGEDPQEWFEAADRFLATASFTRPPRERAEHRQSFWERAAAQGVGAFKEITQLPQELWEDAFFATVRPHAVTLRNASLRAPGEAWEDVGMIRVVLKQVQAWWTVRLQVPEEAEPYLPPE